MIPPAPAKRAHSISGVNSIIYERGNFLSAAGAVFSLIAIVFPSFSYSQETLKENLEFWSEFTPTGHGTVEYQVHVRNHSDGRIMCQVEVDWMDTYFRVRADRIAIVVYPGRENWVAVHPVTGGVGCTRSFGSLDENGHMDNMADTVTCSSGQQFKFRFGLEQCRVME